MGGLHQWLYVATLGGGGRQLGCICPRERHVHGISSRLQQVRMKLKAAPARQLRRPRPHGRDLRVRAAIRNPQWAAFMPIRGLVSSQSVPMLLAHRAVHAKVLGALITGAPFLLLAPNVVEELDSLQATMSMLLLDAPV